MCVCVCVYICIASWFWHKNYFRVKIFEILPELPLSD